MPNGVYAECHKQALYAGCLQAECHYAECRYAKYRGAKMITSLILKGPTKDSNRGPVL